MILFAGEILTLLPRAVSHEQEHFFNVETLQNPAWDWSRELRCWNSLQNFYTLLYYRLGHIIIISILYHNDSHWKLPESEQWIRPRSVRSSQTVSCSTLLKMRDSELIHILEPSYVLPTRKVYVKGTLTFIYRSILCLVPSYSTCLIT